MGMGISLCFQVAKDNGKPMLLGRLVVDDSSVGRRGRLRDLLGAELRRTSLLLWFIWFVFFRGQKIT